MNLAVSYDQGYDDPNRSLTVLSCSDGANGLITKHGWKTQKNVPTFPRVGGSGDIAGRNSPKVRPYFPFSDTNVLLEHES